MQSLRMKAAAAGLLGLAIALVAMTAHMNRRTVLLTDMNPYAMYSVPAAGFEVYPGQQLFTIDDFDSGRVSFDPHGLRGRDQVVDSLDRNLNINDHHWEHQVNIAEAPMQEWPMTTAGMKAKTSQLRTAGDIPAKFDSENPQVLKKEVDDVKAKRRNLKKEEQDMSAEERRLQIEYHTVMQRERRAGEDKFAIPHPHQKAMRPAQPPQQQQQKPQQQQQGEIVRPPLERGEYVPPMQEQEGSFPGIREAGMRWNPVMGTNIAFMKTEDFPKVMERSWHTRAETAEDDEPLMY
mmetsp:Transcript_66239/g.138030  ORF Transcript_66239/g.138030 Transcript_66239/m.138030 type:complete len:292 (-) Transcript_66239:133-1008(-)|eukprot:CAMPEP_0181314046 /NCGR_PEP_ID=MMETSP1101-20121128/14593_1 /TAXON_ID=46948 /ORGANISM="Rhodomonas abbreviata, Strain Caron Lab Isolate" /LENGTH=291 /DNA_ID=CAMNT_0023421081 /DNA_START=15 /DNA_END=890 /DNA_ORIENTATION=+